MKEVLGRPIDRHRIKIFDSHFHTREKGMTPLETVLLAEDRGLNAIAITAHNKIDPALEALEAAKKAKLKLQVVIGEEIATLDGHIIALFINELVKRKMSVEETIIDIHRQGGLVIVPHPFFPSAPSLQEESISRIIQSYDNNVYIDGFEVYNLGVAQVSSLRGKKDSNCRAREFYLANKNFLGAPFAGSDGHRFTVGGALTGYKEDLYSDIISGNTLAIVLNIHEQMDIVGISRCMFSQTEKWGMRSLKEIKNFIEQIDK